MGRNEYRKMFEQERLHLLKRVAARAEYKQTERGKERLQAGGVAWIGRNPEKRAAYIIVGNAVRDGKLVKQSCACGNPKSEAHHEDYAKPLEVIWLCRRCHVDLHKERAACLIPSPPPTPFPPSPARCG